MHKISSVNMSLSVVIPCLNEAETIHMAVREAIEGLHLTGLKGEVIVADNGSTDGSQSIAASLGANVVQVADRGYGAALDGGVRAASTDLVVFADADCSYPFLETVNLLRPILDDTARFVLGNRLNSKMESGAMPTLNRYMGTPVLSWLIRRIYGIPITDCNSGMRLFYRSDYDTLGLSSPGMEYASEMIVAVATQKIPYAEVEISFRKDRRNRPPHLKRWRDGWRHLRYILGSAPSWMIVLAPLFLGTLLSGVAFLISLTEFFSDRAIRFHSAFFMISIAAVMYTFGVGQFALRALRHQSGKVLSRGMKLWEKFSQDGAPFYYSMAIFGLAGLQALILFYQWVQVEFGDLSEIGGLIRFSVLMLWATSLLSIEMSFGLIRMMKR